MTGRHGFDTTSAAKLDRAEILARSRHEASDEGELHIANRSNYYEALFAAIEILAVILFAIVWYWTGDHSYLDLLGVLAPFFALSLAMISGRSLALYQGRGRQRTWLVRTVGGLLLSAVFLVLFMVHLAA
ncbi:DUF6442 family protein [Bifidobacterium eulemuris]|uniref:Uncharacterized protein n=1 Tax=Bifidobacterium eulemuris TaxID=1765219 RepID=A0A261GCC4_9BIFI|nr:DUF6442 family protein [Bifidobacterium eulemuris]OZG69070.1 hypothetical protein BEUL_0476 [Bifidobacterium eulemuris]QOL31405.1 hypothetical protein BE0216_02230 [Bifidobacterium eulemuris]